MSNGGLWEIPDSWVWTRIEEIYEVVGGGTPPTSVETYWNGDIPWITSADIHGPKRILPRKTVTRAGVENSATSVVPRGSIIVVTRVSLGKVGLVSQPLCFSQDSQALVDRSGMVDPEYALHYLSLAVNEFRHSGRGTTISGVTKKQLKELAFPLAPLSEQRKVVEKIEELSSQLDAGLAALVHAGANLERYRASVLRAACEGRLVPTEAELARREDRDYKRAGILLQDILAERREKWEEGEWSRLVDKAKKNAAQATVKTDGRSAKLSTMKPDEWNTLVEKSYAKYLPRDDRWKLRYKEPEPPTESDLPVLPEGWAWAALQQLASIETGATPLRGKSEYWKDGDIPWVTSGAVNEPLISGADEYITEQALDETNAKIFPAGSLLVAMYGEGKTRGKVSEMAIDAATNQACAAIIIRGTAYDLKPFIRLYFEKNYTNLRNLSSGGVQPNLNLGIIRSTPIPIPPFEEQERITAKTSLALSVIRNLKRSVGQGKSRAAILRLAMLKSAFEGLLVPRGANDEDARVLLDRIRAGSDAFGND